MTGWWRSNAIALGALVVLVPAAALTMSWNEWAEIRQSTATEPIRVEPGDSVRYADAVVGPVSAEFTELCPASSVVMVRSCVHPSPSRVETD